MSLICIVSQLSNSLSFEENWWLNILNYGYLGLYDDYIV